MSLDFIKANYEKGLQYVRCGAVKSSIKSQEPGVIQGSNTEPLFFDINSSDFARMCSNDESILYADDTVLVYVGKSLEMLAEHVLSRLREIFELCNCNKLFLNPTKSNFMTVSNKTIVKSS